MGSRRKSKKQRNGEGDGEGNSNESGMGMRICDLPDPILHRILSSLPTKEAIQTSVLSKRWEHLWKNISKIELREGYLTHLQEPEAEKRRQKFMNFANRLLAACDCTRLKNFFLSCRVGQDASQINQWLCCFINPKIKELSLDFEEILEPLVFPDHLFTCSTLTKFRLDMPHIFKLPSSIHFQSLRTLILLNVIFPDSSSTQNFFSGCPALEELYLTSCNLENVEAFVISCPLLQNLDISEMEYDGLTDPNCCKVVIIGTNLKTFDYEGDYLNEYLLYDSTSVINASIKVLVPLVYTGDHYYSCQLDLGYFLFNLVKGFPNLEKLCISYSFITALSRTGLLLKCMPLCFPNLVELTLDTTGAVSLEDPGLLAMSHYSPNLEAIRFEEGVSLTKDNAECILGCIPLCFSNLKTIEINGFNGEEEELFAIKILLQVASALDKLLIQCYSSLSVSDDVDNHRERSEKFHKQILTYPKRSMDCKIEFEHKMW
ncbi:hypothetical protein PIB30_061298 [Stylosanthes scabra]|uniref:F-box domain-containing protein n=1 Tax=Stylosanthes scabra TaxID=79078 RepID=A0ABU6XJC2_9FABA|nr:hypothetical protein [Stylosanthes scabra]